MRNGRIRGSEKWLDGSRHIYLREKSSSLRLIDKTNMIDRKNRESKYDSPRRNQATSSHLIESSHPLPSPSISISYPSPNSRGSNDSAPLPGPGLRAPRLAAVECSQDQQEHQDEDYSREDQDDFALVHVVGGGMVVVWMKRIGGKGGLGLGGSWGFCFIFFYCIKMCGGSGMVCET